MGRQFCEPNECITNVASCAPNGTCVLSGNRDGEWRCLCGHGFTPTADGRGCQEVPKVAFHAQYSSTPILNVNDIANFDQVDINIGQGYQNGVFTAPVAGIYAFVATFTVFQTCFAQWNMYMQRYYPPAIRSQLVMALGMLPSS